MFECSTYRAKSELIGVFAFSPTVKGKIAADDRRIAGFLISSYSNHR
jgi:hypothetical protein